MAFKDSPGLHRQLNNFTWKWDFPVSTVKDGHKCVESSERSEASAQHGAKLTFGEVLESGVSRMLYNMRANQKKTFHDLGMGPGKMLIQTFLMYPNLTFCMGVELAKGRYMLAEHNLGALCRRGWRGRSFTEVEYMRGKFMKIVEMTLDRVPRGGFTRGSLVVAYDTTLRQDPHDFPNYDAVVVDVNSDGTVVVDYEAGRTGVVVDECFVFARGTNRECEIWFGNLFDYPNGWDADLIIMETDFPEKVRDQLMQGMLTTPIGCLFLTYHDLKKWYDIYDNDALRQVHVNCFDNDRYLTSWSQGWRFYIWEHVHSPIGHSPLPRDLALLMDEERVGVMNDGKWRWASVADARGNDVVVEFEDKETGEETSEVISRSEDRIRLHRPQFKRGTTVVCYWPNFIENQMRSAFEMYRAVIVGFQPNGAYMLKYEDGDTHNNVHPHWIIRLPELKYSAGDRVLSCWPQYAQNKNSPDRYKKFEAVIAAVNADASYSVKYSHGDQAPRVREMWITTPEEELYLQKRLEPLRSTPEIRQLPAWCPRTVAVWLVELSMVQVAKRVIECNVDGSELLSMDVQILMDVLSIKRKLARTLHGSIQRYSERRVALLGKPWAKRWESRKGKRERDSISPWSRTKRWLLNPRSGTSTPTASAATSVSASPSPFRLGNTRSLSPSLSPTYVSSARIRRHNRALSPSLPRSGKIKFKRAVLRENSSEPRRGKGNKSGRLRRQPSVLNARPGGGDSSRDRNIQKENDSCGDVSDCFGRKRRSDVYYTN